LSPDRVIERERRWAPAATIAALIALGLLIAGVILGSSIPSQDHTGDQLRAFDDHARALTASSVITGIAFVLLAVPLLYLFRAAEARNPRVHRALVAFCFIGPLLLGAQSVAKGLAYPSVASDFVSHVDQEGTQDSEEFLRQVERDPSSIEKVTFHTDSDLLEVEQADGRFYSTQYEAGQEAQITKRVNAASPSIDNEDDSDGEVGDALADRLLADSGGVGVAQSLIFPALLGMVVVMVYVPLQALRAGLLTRFFGTLGMALGVSLIVLPQAQLLIALWFGYLALLFVGRAPGGRPPAWDAGEAVPWPRPGEESAPTSRSPDDGDEGAAVEADGAREVTPAGGSQPAKRKRKRRR
jgi:hypothetical protein